MAMLGNLHRRVGDDDASAQALASLEPVAGALSVDRRAWARIIYSDIDVRQDGTVNPSSQGHVSGFQTGTDLYVSPPGDWRAGVYVGQLDGSADVSGSASGLWRAVGSTDLRTRYFAAYATYANTTGFYADVVLQYGSQRYTIRPLGSLESSADGSSLLAAVEVGQAYALGGNWTLEPQAQLIYSHARLDDLVIPGALVQHRDLDSWTGVLGARVKGDFATSAGRLQPYGRVAVVHGSGGNTVARFIGPAAFSDIVSASSYTSMELAGGFTLTASRRLSFYGEIGRLFSTGGDTEVKSSIQGSLGMRVRW
jgi:outer membrane autotransporter protein